MNPKFWHYIFDAIDDLVFLHDMHFVCCLNHAYCHEAGMTEVEALLREQHYAFKTDDT